MSTSKLQLYNAALTICGERHLASLAEDREPRHLLDNVWDNDGVKHCLAQAEWAFATRTVRMDYDTSISPDYGYTYAFEKPSDWCRTVAICSDEYFNSPMTSFEDEAGYWYADIDEIYVRYISNDSLYGGDYSLWHPHFVDFVAAHFAYKIIYKLTSDKGKRQDVSDERMKLLSDAKNSDAIGKPTRFQPSGTWSGSRKSKRSGPWADRGRRGQLIG